MQSGPIGRPDAIVIRTYDTGMRKLEYILITVYAYPYIRNKASKPTPHP